MAIVASPADVPLQKPLPGVRAGDAPLYLYDPRIESNGKSENAAEIFLVNEPVTIVETQSSTLNTRLDRNVAMVEVIVNKATANFNKAATDNRIELHRIPSTISYTGKLLPNTHAPDTLPAGKYLRANVTLKDHPTEKGYLTADTVRFLIPAHRGNDFMAANPVDTITLKMLLAVNFERTGGTRFVKSKEIQAVAKCNKILRVRLNVNDGLALSTEILPWQEVDVNKTLGEGYTNWLYVKYDQHGSGQSWQDPLPSIASAIEMTRRLRAESVTVNGILVAGEATFDYREGFAVPAKTRIFGGWAGTPGTELSANDTMAPYTSAHRDLLKHKAAIELGTADSITLDSAASLLDGFIITSTAGISAIPVTVNHATAQINAIEIRNHETQGAHVLSILNGTGTNILVANNNKGVAVGSNGQLVNATIVNNSTASSFKGTLRNSVYWGNGGSVEALGSIEYSAFPGTAPLPGTGNIPINPSNLAWFSLSDTIPGPHFNVNGTPEYAANVLAPNRSPLLGRGNKAAFDNATATISTAGKRDLNGNPRHNGETDIGCYEGAGSATGFRLQWNIKRIYMSSKSNSLSEHPLILSENSENAVVAWRLAVAGAYSSNGTFTPGPSMTNATLETTSGNGSGTMPGIFKIMSSSEANTSDKEVPRGRLRLTSNLGSYLPDIDIDVYQAPGNPRPWEEGYVGSFHRNNETKERYIHGKNSGEWTIRIIHGIDWIKIDGNNKGAYAGEVQEIVGGELKGTGNIKFRVGMKSTLSVGASPRYGLITIQKNGGLALFFVRQGEEADYLFRPEDPRTQGVRDNAVKFAPFTLKDPQENESISGRELGAQGGAFSDYPTWIGYWFQWNRSRAYLLGTAKGGSGYIPDLQPTAWESSKEVCPPGYRQANLTEWVHSIYWNVAVPAPGNILSPDGQGVLGNYVYGRYADGYYDQLAPDPVDASTDLVGSGPKRAKKGILMINHYNYASVFFPVGGAMARANLGYVNGAIYETTSVNWVAEVKEKGKIPYSTHWDAGHLGISCSTLSGLESAIVRCVKK
jgi:hypothetical protein